MKRAGGDDPLSGPAFPHFWESGENSPLDQILLAAATLRTSDKDSLVLLKKAREAATTDSDRLRLDHAIARIALAQKMYADLLSSADFAASVHPNSDTAFSWKSIALRQLKRDAELDSLIATRLEKRPNDQAALRVGLQYALNRGNWGRMRDFMKRLTDAGFAGIGDYNNMAWAGLAEKGGTDEVIQLAHKAITSQNKSFDSLHTVAAAYADGGKIAEAREYLVQALDSAELAAPNPACWLVLGMIAHRLDLKDTAKELYGRVISDPKQDESTPHSIATLARSRLAQLGAH
jgi:tetratricopeptide (TPR) repeat protein